VPERAFVNLFRRQLELLRDPCQRAAELTMDELLRMIWGLESKSSGDLARFPKLGAKVTEIGANTLRDALVPTLEHIDALLQCEAAYINTQHKDFIGRDTMLGHSTGDTNSVKSDAPRSPPPRAEKSGGFLSSLFGGSGPNDDADLPPVVQSVVPTRFEPGDELSARDKKQIALLRQLLSSYFGIVQANIQDSVTKAIMHFLVNQSKAELHKNLVHELYREELLAELLQEDASVSAKREAARQQLKALTLAKGLLQEAELLQRA
jgi:dynamin 1-like protein